MKFIKERVQVICDGLKKQMLRDTAELTEWAAKPGNYFHPRDAAGAPAPFEPFDSLRDHWYGPDGHYWFKTVFTVPETLAGRPLALVVRTQIDGWDDGKNPQFLLFLNGAVVQGLDLNHREVMLGSHAAGAVLDIQLAAYTGTLHSEFRLLAEVSAVEEGVLGLYYDLTMPLQALERLAPEGKTALDILTALNDTINLLDFRTLYSPEYFAGVEAARNHVAKALYEDMADERVVASCIGHTHIDVAWWWTVAQTREKTARSFATVLKLMGEYPEYKFMSSQPQLYVFLKERYPELYAQVKQRVAEGRWEPEGGMWVEADCNLTSGESLVRQFLYGKRFFRDEFGADNKILWLPDVFGYSAALPQICKRCGIDYFMTTKLSWNQYNMIPFDTFRWRGIDGSEVFTHLITTLGVGQSTERFFTTYNGMLHPDAIMGAWQRYQQKDIDNDILIAYGYGDGGGGPTREMLETGRRMAAGVRDIPKVRQAFAGEYFEELEGRVGENKRLPTWVGELYFEYHRGTYTSMARNKRSNRKSELLLMDAELLGVLAAPAAGLAGPAAPPYPAEELEALWKTVLLNQFHDILPGSSIKEVYEVTAAEYAQIAAEGEALVAERTRALAGEGDGLVLFNTLGFVRDDIVALGKVDATALRDKQGREYPVQQTAAGAVAFARGLPSKGFAGFEPVRGGGAAKSPFSIDGRAIETPYYSVRFDAAGNITGLLDKAAGRELFAEDGPGNRMRMYEDKPIYFDNWDIDVFHTEKYWDLEGLSAFEWTEDGPVRATLHLERAFSHSVMRQDIRFYADSPRIDFETWVDWRESQHLLRVLFPLRLNTDEATFSIQFGNVTRKTHKNTSWDQARFESCAHQWMDVAEGDYGVALLNDCKYGHSVDDGVMGLTLIKSGIEPNPTTDQEEHWFTYSLLPHTGGWKEAEVPKHAACLNQPVRVAPGDAAAAFSLAAAGSANIVLETVKQAEDGRGVILRLYDYHNTRSDDAFVALFRAPAAAYSCDLLENDEAPLAVEDDRVRFSLKPFEIKTIRVLW